MRDYLLNMNLKAEMSQDEIKRLTGKLTRKSPVLRATLLPDHSDLFFIGQEERIEEMRDIHRLESKSQSDQIEKLRAQVEEAEALLKVSQSSHAQVEQESSKRKTEIEHLQGELEKARGLVREEEEKRTKAIALLKTVRQSS